MAARMLPEAFDGLEKIIDRGPVFLRQGSMPEQISFAQLMRRARHLQGQLQSQGLLKGARVGLLVGDNADFIISFLAIVMAGAVPVPGPAPTTLGANTSYAGTIARMFEVARVEALLMSRIAMRRLAQLDASIGTVRHSMIFEDLSEGPLIPPYLVEVRPEDPCFIQFTSGSTAAPKGVVVTHANLAANAEAIAVDTLRLDPLTDIGVCWLPLHHDMGLVGNVLTALLYQVPVVYMSTLQFVKNARSWMKVVSDYRGTITFGPNFALALAASRADDAYIEGLDLHSLRTLGCGAEPISADVLRHFASVFERAGLKSQAIRPCYGMAEATLAISFGQAGTAPRTVRVLRSALESEGIARAPLTECNDACVELVSCGSCIPNHNVEIVGDNGIGLAENRVGEIIFSGPSVAQGYYRNSQATREVFQDIGMRTGDLGFIRDGELFIIGRSKDLVIIHGRNYSPQDIEQAVESIEGVRLGGTVAFAVGERSTERLVVVVETRLSSTDVLSQQVKEMIVRVFGIGRLEVAFTDPGRLPKTSSGKLQRGRARQLYEEGAFAK
jgi:fatty-acyl-CoA synthase